MPAQRFSSASKANIGNSTIHEKCIAFGSYSFSSAPSFFRRACSALQVTAQVSATKSRRSPGLAFIRSLNLREQLGGEVLGDRRPELAVRLDAEPGQALGAELLDELGQLVDQLAAVERRRRPGR